MHDKLSIQIGAILLGGYISLITSQEIKLIILVLLLLVLIRVYFIWKPTDFMGRQLRPEIILLVCGLCAGFIYSLFAEERLPPLIVDGIKVEGIVTDWTVRSDIARGVIRLERFSPPELAEGLERANTVSFSEHVGQNYMLKLFPQGGKYSDEWLKVRPGDRISFSGKLEHPPPPGTVGQFDLPLYYAVRNLNGSIAAKGQLTLIEAGSPPLSWRVRHKVQDVLTKYWLEEGSVLEGILFGDTSGIPAETLDIYKASGVMHVFAASGANVAFVITLVMAVLFFVPLKGRVIITIGCIVFYAILCRGNPPILRATILGIAVLIGMLDRKKIHSSRMLWIAGLMLFIWQPLFLKDTSFQLSFAATWGMVVLAPQIENTLLIQKLPRLLRGGAAVALATQIAAFPILIDIFHRISLVGLITNIFALFLLGAVLQLGLIGTLLIIFPGIHLIFFQAALWLLNASSYVLGTIASFPWAYFWVLNPGKIFWLGWYVSLAIYLVGANKVWFMVRVQLRKVRLLVVKRGRSSQKNQASEYASTVKFQKFRTGKYLVTLMDLYDQMLRLGLQRFILPVILIVLLVLPGSVSNKLQITFLDVGQGDCIVITTAKEKFLVDTGPRSEQFDAGERVILPYLMERRIRELDMVFITHEDSDHLGGAGYVLSNIPTGQIAVPSVDMRLDNDAWRSGLTNSVRMSSDQLLQLKAGDRLEFTSGVQIESLAPVTVLNHTAADANNNSLVLMLTYYNTKILLTGDMETEEMISIADRGASWQADFIKLPHHGAKGSLDTAWFDKTFPQAVFICVGKNNFGHPSTEVTHYWTERGVPIYRTDLHGSIDLVIDEHGYQILTGRGQ